MKLGEAVLKGLYAALPAASTPGRLYYSTDYGVLYRDNGTSWDALLDINALSAKASPDSEADFGVIYDAAAGYLKKVLLSNWPGAGGGGGGAPADAEYVVTEANGTLTDEVVIPSLAGHPDRLPASPDANDDEFDSSTLDVAWTPTSDAASYDIDTFWPSCLHAVFTGNQGIELIKDYAPGASTAFSVTAKFLPALRSNYAQVLIELLDSGLANGVRINYIYSANWKSEYSKLTSGSWSYGVTVLEVWSYHNSVYLHAQRDASDNWSYWISFDGYGWIRVATASYSFTVAKVRAIIDQNGQTTPTHMGIDWIRFNWTTL